MTSQLANSVIRFLAYTSSHAIQNYASLPLRDCRMGSIFWTSRLHSSSYTNNSHYARCFSPYSHTLSSRLSQRFCAPITSALRALHLNTKAPTMPPPPMSFEEYKEKQYEKKTLLTFEEYSAKNKDQAITTPQRSAEAMIEEAYDLYVHLCYRGYLKQFEPPSNPFIF